MYKCQQLVRLNNIGFCHRCEEGVGGSHNQLSHEVCFQSHPWLVSSPIPIRSFLESTGFFFCFLLTCYAQCYHGDGSGVRHVHKYHSHSLYYQATFGNSDRPFSIYCCHGDGGDWRHVCSKPYTLLSGNYVGNSD